MNDRALDASIAGAFARKPEDLDGLSGQIDGILRLVAEEWRTMDAAGHGPCSGATPRELREWVASAVGRPLSTNARDPEDEFGDGDAWRSNLLRGVLRHSIQLRHPATAAHLHCPPLKDAVATEVLIALLNQSMDSFDQSGVATLLESHLIDWLSVSCFDGETTNGDGVFTSGGTQSNLMGLLLARERAVQALYGLSAMQHGLPAEAHALRVLCQEHAHFSAVQAAGLLGLGRDAVVPIEVDDGGGVNVPAARSACEELRRTGLTPFCFFATAGTTDRGAIDDLTALRALCEEFSLWLHVDAAYGGALLFTRHRHRLQGLSGADSITIDFHKLFFQPIACGAFVVRDANSFAGMRQHADYLNREDDAFPNLVDRSLATTRRFDALKLLVSLGEPGQSRFETMIERLFELTTFARDRIVERPELELAVEPALTTVLFRCAGSDTLNSAVRDRLLASGTAIIGESRLDGRVILKLTFMNPAVSPGEVERLLDQITRNATAIRRELSRREERNSARNGGVTEVARPNENTPSMEILL